jgi:putative redox protein
LGVPSENLTFPGALSAELAARLERPEGEPIAYALFAHCFTCSKDLQAVREISRTLCDEGFAVLRFDFTGLGESEGDFAESDFSSNIDDLVAAADYLRREYQAPGLLIGHSLGGAAVLLAASRIPEAKAVATIGAPSDTKHLRASLIRTAPELTAADEAEVELGDRKFKIKRQLLDDLEAQDVEQRLSGLKVPLLVLHSPTDETVAIEHARRIYDAAQHPKSFVSLDDADHLLTKPRDARFVARLLAAWSARYLAAADVAHVTNRIPEGTVEVRGGRTGYAVEIETASHRLAADEPIDVGGTDSGPNPYELLLGALGACIAITARLYADRKGWPLTQTIVRLAHDKIHAEDCAECETVEGLVDRIEVDIEFQGSLSDGQRARLREIADRCPVHRTLTSEIVTAKP